MADNSDSFTCDSHEETHTRRASRLVLRGTADVWGDRLKSKDKKRKEEEKTRGRGVRARV